MTYNAADRKDVRRLEKASRLAEVQRLEVVTSLMSTIPGRSWILEKLEAAHVFATSFNENALVMAFAEGERNQGLMILNDLMSSCPDKYILMMQERNEKANGRATDTRERDSTERDGRDSGTGISEEPGDAGDEDYPRDAA